MAQQTIGTTRLAQRTSAAIANANFAELYARYSQLQALAATAAGSLVVPAGYAITGIYMVNNTANAVTGGIKIGTAAGGTQVVAAQAVAANAVVAVADAAILLKLFSKTAPQTIYFDAVTAWNSANVDIIVMTRKVY